MTQSIIPFNFHSHAVRVVMRDGNPWFVATDVCTVLGYRNPSKAIADHLDDDERSNEQLDRSRMGSKAVIISESGLYALILRSRKPEARKFAKWVTSEVMPSIRKTGGYSASHPPAVTLTEVEAFRLYALLRMVAGHLSRERIEPIEQALHLIRSPLAGAVSDLWREVGPRAKRMENLAGRCRNAYHRLR
ncbi:hypothetical protein HKJ31_00920 [Xylella fastidiosa subsp. multiplex]|uniref:BRO-N domain-containing protein n=1 Tax=Xylella fastidiosa TaxID=2371 RepID=UPI001463601F|nr:Bro-N domain-containing protein [Xylella fastidiosa]QJP49303.1 hypothetical protein HKJ31_00920 [Xylella fastidiosa subsp. multiplex]